MLDRTDELVVGAVVVGCGFLIVGLSIQDWGGKAGAAVTVDVHDHSWGTWVTDYVLAAMGAAFGIYAPGHGLLRLVASVAFVLEGVCFAFDGLMHQFCPTRGLPHVVLSSLSELTLSVALVAKACAALLFIQELGIARYCGARSLTSGQRKTTKVFGAIALVSSILVVGLTLWRPAVGGWVDLVGLKVVAVCSTIGFGVMGGAYLSGVGMFVGFVVTVWIEQLTFGPFSRSTAFNDQALGHSVYMLFLSASYGVLLELNASAMEQARNREEMLRQRAEEEWAREAEKLEEDRRASASRPWMASCTGCAAGDLDPRRQASSSTWR